MSDSRVVALLRELNEQGCIATCTRCPVCERDRKFSVNFRDGLALYCCHRATCGVRGVYAIADGATSSERRSAPAFTPRPLEAEYRVPQPGERWYRLLETRGVARESIATWCLTYGFRVLEADPDTCVWQIRNSVGFLLGHQTRTLDKRVQSWFTSPLPRYAAFLKSPHVPTPILVVEDCMSAALFPGPAIALLGTNLSREVATELARLNDHVYVALDPDAIGKAQAMVERLRAAGAQAYVQPITNDVKNMTVSERMELFRSMT